MSTLRRPNVVMTTHMRTRFNKRGHKNIGMDVRGSGTRIRTAARLKRVRNMRHKLGWA